MLILGQKLLQFPSTSQQNRKQNLKNPKFDSKFFKRDHAQLLISRANFFFML